MYRCQLTLRHWNVEGRLEKTHTDTGRTYKQHCSRSQTQVYGAVKQQLYRSVTVFHLYFTCFISYSIRTCITASSLCICLSSVLHSGSKCADDQPFQWISPASGCRGSATHKSTPRNSHGEYMLSIFIAPFAPLQCAVKSNFCIFIISWVKSFLVLPKLTAKNIQCMRTLLNLAHCHGSVLGTSWQLVLATLQVR